MKISKSIFVLLISLMTIHTLHSQIHDCYKTIDRIIWVVDDLEQVKSGWQKLGFDTFFDHGITKVSDELQNGKMAKHSINYSTAFLGDQQAIWIQPIKGKSLYRDYLKKNGPGALVILHRINSMEAMNAEIERMQNLGIPVLQKGQFKEEGGNIQYVYFDTLEKGRYIIGLTYSKNQPATIPVVNKNNLQFSQVAFAVNNVDPIKAFWTNLGFPKFNMVYPEGWDNEYYGKPADFKMELAFQHPGKVAYEWCMPITPPTVYADHIERFGEGIQHFGYNVEDMDLALDEMKKQGLVISQSGGWGEKGKPGSGRFAYVNMEDWGGESIELLWSF